MTLETMAMQVLWPYLLELLVIGDYSDSLGVLCRSINNIASRKRSSGDVDYNIDFVINGHLTFFLQNSVLCNSPLQPLMLLFVSVIVLRLFVDELRF